MPTPPDHSSAPVWNDDAADPSISDDVVSVIERGYFGMRTMPLSGRDFWGCVFWPESPPPEREGGQALSPRGDVGR